MATPVVKKMLMSDYFSSTKKKRQSIVANEQKRHRLSIQEDQEYEKIPICGIYVQLPPGLKPYPTQKLMMVRMLQSLDKKLNALIESPTGSGKTMALLASSCAWLAKYKEERCDKARRECRIHGDFAFALPSTSSVHAKADATLDTSANKSGDLFPASPQPAATVDKEKAKARKQEPVYLIDEMEEELREDFIPPSTPRTPFDISASKLDAEASEAKTEGCTCEPRIRIYYGTRTHRQIAQVVKEYGRLPFGVKGALKHTILASREQSCINEHARASGDITSHCRDLLSKHGDGCTPHRNIRPRYEKGPSMRNFVNEEFGAVWDMEELVDTLKSTKPQMCPYFASNRIMTSDADIIFCPYNYLIDPIIRNSSDVHLNNSIVILDEAHNIEDTCREAASYTFTEQEVFATADDLFRKSRRLWSEVCPQKALSTQIDLGACEDTCGPLADADPRLVDCLKKLVSLSDFAHAFHRWISDLAEETHEVGALSDGTRSLTLPFANLYNSLDKATILHLEDSADYKNLLSALGAAADMGNDETSIYQATFAASKPTPQSIVAVEKFLYFLKFFSRAKEFYKCNITMGPIGGSSRGRFSDYTQASQISQPAPIGAPGGSDWHDPRNVPAKFRPAVAGCEAVLKIWCMMPSVVCEDALQDCRSVILASGTLCPTETFKTELGIEFKLHMEGDQVISKDRIFAAAIAKGPNGNSLCAVYRNLAPNSPFYYELAQILLEVCQTVPKGVLCFVSSYRILDLLMQTLRNSNYKRLIEQKKVVLEEPRRSSELQSVMQQYNDAIASPKSFGWSCDGALMIAVFRGKVSEGIDFTDDKARCVVCVGIPFPNTRDDVVNEKKKFNDEHRVTYRLISGDQWYATQAYRALNQALGRCLRHKEDWGALLLVDERFVQNARSNAQQSESQKISKWVRENLRIHRDYKDFMTDLAEFVQSRLSLDAASEDVKLVKPLKPMPTLDGEPPRNSAPSGADERKPRVRATPLNRRNPFFL